MNAPAGPTIFGRLLWVDCTGAALAGAVVVALSSPLSSLEGLPREVLLFTGAANLLYGACSFSLAMRRERPMRLVKLLALANFAWSLVCLGIAAAFWMAATPLAFLHLFGEAFYVGALASLEWRHRDLLATAA